MNTNIDGLISSITSEDINILKLIALEIASTIRESKNENIVSRERLSKLLVEAITIYDSNKKFEVYKNSSDFYRGVIYIYYELVSALVFGNKKDTYSARLRSVEEVSLVDYLIERGKTDEVTLARDLNTTTEELYIRVNDSILSGENNIIMTLENHIVYYKVNSSVATKRRIDRYKTVENFTIKESNK